MDTVKLYFLPNDQTIPIEIQAKRITVEINAVLLFIFFHGNSSHSRAPFCSFPFAVSLSQPCLRRTESFFNTLFKWVWCLAKVLFLFPSVLYSILILLCFKNKQTRSVDDPMYARKCDSISFSWFSKNLKTNYCRNINSAEKKATATISWTSFNFEFWCITALLYYRLKRLLNTVYKCSEVSQKELTYFSLIL